MRRNQYWQWSCIFTLWLCCIFYGTTNEASSNTLQDQSILQTLISDLSLLQDSLSEPEKPQLTLVQQRSYYQQASGLLQQAQTLQQKMYFQKKIYLQAQASDFSSLVKDSLAENSLVEKNKNQKEVKVHSVKQSLDKNNSDKDDSDKAEFRSERRYDLYQSQLKQHLTDYQKLAPYLETYPLQPYLAYRKLLLGLGEKSPSEIHQFIHQYKNLPFTRRVTARYLNALYQNQHWQAILKFQPNEPYAEQSRCVFYFAHYQLGDVDIAYQGAKKLWRSGKNIASTCNELFTAWQTDDSSSWGDQAIFERMLLTFKADNYKLTKYLSTLLKTKATQQQAQVLLDLIKHPNHVSQLHLHVPVSDWSRQLSVYILRKLARKNTEQAQAAYVIVSEQQQFTEEVKQSLAEYIARRLISTKDVNFIQWRDDIVRHSHSIPLIEWRARLAIQTADWKKVEYWIYLLPEKQQATKRWRYWQGRIDIALGKAPQGKARLLSILGDRNFYSVAAAKALNVPVQYTNKAVNFNLDNILIYQDRLARIGELIALDKMITAKQEWRYLLRSVSPENQKILAVYANNMHWNHLTVMATIEGKMWDYLSLRFPVAHRALFDFYSKKHNIDIATLMGLSRQESGFNVEARSPVGARGLMQLMPTTAKHVAKKFKLKYNQAAQLNHAEKNIEIGSQYFASLLQRYDNNRIFALAAYNAGPTRVTRWRKQSQHKLDAYAFIEAIPFNETRRYVQNILMFAVYYRGILDIDGSFLSSDEANKAY